MWILLIALVLVVAGALIARVVRAGWTGSALAPNDQPTPPANNNNLTNWLAFENMQQAQNSLPTTDTSFTDPPAFSSDSDNAPQPDYSDPGGVSSPASDPSTSGYDPGSGGSDGGGLGGGGGDAF